jgi:acetyl-CoA C-acetyltransferase
MTGNNRHRPDLLVFAARRTALGRFNGLFRQVSATALGSAALRAALSGLNPDQLPIEELLLGQVLGAGCGQAPARQAALGAGLPSTLPCATVNKVCGSGMKAIALLCDQLKAGTLQLGLAGGMENMSRAPYLNPEQRFGSRLGHRQHFDHMFLDGLEDPYSGQLMGQIADRCALEHGISRSAMDEFAIQSVQRAQQAVTEGWFEAELCAVEVTEQDLLQDEIPLTLNTDRVASLTPAFGTQGQITAANAASIADGAAALLLGTAGAAGPLRPLARIVGYSQHAEAPDRFPLAPIGAIQKLLDSLNWQVTEVDLFELNEAFASVCLHAQQALGIPTARLNVQGGACALGHPIGATGARIVVTLIHALRQRGLDRGIASLCIGGGEAMALAVEVADFAPGS